MVEPIQYFDTSGPLSRGDRAGARSAVQPIVRRDVPRFNLEPTLSFPEMAPQREEYLSDELFDAACRKYGAEWREEYRCCDTKCRNPDCPQHYPMD